MLILGCTEEWFNNFNVVPSKYGIIPRETENYAHTGVH